VAPALRCRETPYRPGSRLPFRCRIWSNAFSCRALYLLAHVRTCPRQRLFVCRLTILARLGHSTRPLPCPKHPAPAGGGHVDLLASTKSSSPAARPGSGFSCRLLLAPTASRKTITRLAAVQRGSKTSAPCLVGSPSCEKIPSFTFGTMFALVRDQHWANHRERGIRKCGPSIFHEDRDPMRTMRRRSTIVHPWTCYPGPIRTSRNSLRGRLPRHGALGGGPTPRRSFIAHIRPL